MAGLVVDVATALSRGARETQQDALITDFPVGSDVGFMVLADGMGGHSSGEIASNIIVTEMFAELKFRTLELKNFESRVPAILKSAANYANECIREYVVQNPESYGMGSTVVAPVLVEDRLYWVSVGDSPLYLFRDGQLLQLNQDHSLAPEIDRMVQVGLLTEEQGREHPDRNCLRSVICGAEIPQMDCPQEPFELRSGDIVIVSSDGFQTLCESEITGVVEQHAELPGHGLVSELLAEVVRMDECEQDNISISVIKLSERSGLEASDTADKARNGRQAAGSTRMLQSVSAT